MNLPDPDALFEGSPLFLDTDGDGYPDCISLRILVHPDMEDPSVWSGLLNLTARLAFEVVALRLPLLQKGIRSTGNGPHLIVYPPGLQPRGLRSRALPAAGWHRESNALHLSGTSGPAMMDRLNALALGRRAKDLAPKATGIRNTAPGKRDPAFDLLDLAGLYDSSPTEPKKRRLNALFSLPTEKLVFPMGFALSGLVARLALEATEITLPLAWVGEPKRRGIIFRIQEENTGTNEIRILPAKRSNRRILLLRGSPASLAETIEDWASWALAGFNRGGEACNAFMDHVEAFRRLLGSCGLTDPLPQVRPRTLCRRGRWKSEVERLLEHVEAVPTGHGLLHGVVFLSKPLKRRNRVKVLLEKMLRDRGYEPEITVLNAYKPGLSWLLESVLPRLKKIRRPALLEIRYRPFQGRDGALEMRSRWLQEVFPGPDLVGRALGLHPGKVRMRCRPGLRAVYEVRALDCAGRVRFREGFSPRLSVFPYLSREPELGHVHPTTAGVTLEQKGRIILDVSIPTDRERFWETFQTRWLPALEASMIERLKKASGSEERAFWEDVSIRVSIEETETRLDLGEERIAPMEALHEDLYFVLLQFFTSFARRHGLSPSLQFGRIVPKMKVRPGAPFAALEARPMPWRPETREMLSLRPVPVTVASLAEDKWRFELHQPSTRPEAARFIALARTRGFEVTRAGNEGFRLEVKSPMIRPHTAKARPIGEPPANRLLKAGEVEEWVRRLGRSPYIHAWYPSRSLQGRPIYALEALSPGGDALPSLCKMRLLKPTLFFNARHHANEISSTNATLRMARRLATTKWGRKVLRHVNAVWIPMENVDGVATFEELLPTGRDHILHAARYNALGAEFYGDYFEDPPRFPEAKAKASLWRRWLPDVMVDHHGVPSHEWNQPFSGYVPFQFREFWIPRNFVYVCIPFIDDETHPGHTTALRLADLMSRSMKEEEEIVALNRELADRYRRYARSREPEVFPPSGGQPLLVLPPLGRTYKNNFAVRYPHITRSEIIVEVPDEVTSGKNLELCVRAHFKIEEALLASFRRTRGEVKTWVGSSGSVHFAWVPGKDMFH